MLWLGDQQSSRNIYIYISIFILWSEICESPAAVLRIMINIIKTKLADADKNVRFISMAECIGYYYYILCNYEWAKSLLSVIHRSPRRHSNNFETFKKIGKKFKYIFLIIFGLVESFKQWIGPTRPDHDAIWRLISRKILKIGIWKFDIILIKVFTLCYLNLRDR